MGFQTIDEIKNYVRRVNFCIDHGVPMCELPPGTPVDWSSEDTHNLTDDQLTYIAREATKIRIREANEKHARK